MSYLDSAAATKVSGDRFDSGVVQNPARSGKDAAENLQVLTVESRKYLVNHIILSSIPKPPRPTDLFKSCDNLSDGYSAAVYFAEGRCRGESVTR